MGSIWFYLYSCLVLHEVPWWGLGGEREDGPRGHLPREGGGKTAQGSIFPGKTSRTHQDNAFISKFFMALPNPAVAGGNGSIHPREGGGPQDGQLPRVSGAWGPRRPPRPQAPQPQPEKVPKKKTKKKTKDFQKIFSNHCFLQHLVDFDHQKIKKTEWFLLPELLQTCKLQCSRPSRTKKPSIFLLF